MNASVPISGNRFLVTGGSGFVGSHVVERLVEMGVMEVVVFDKIIRESNLAGVIKSDRVKIVSGDVTRPVELCGAMRGIRGVFHLAAFPLGPCERDHRAALDINVVGTFNVFDAACSSGVQKIVYSSASSVYGDTDSIMDESHPLGARSMYGASKIAGEYFLRAFRQNCALDYVTLRYMNVYGPRQDGGLVMATLRRLSSGKAPIIYGNGLQSFDFVYVDDLALANVAAMERSVTDDVFNIGSDTEATVREVVTHLIDLTGVRVEPEFRIEETGSMRRRVGSSARASCLLGYKATVGLREGLSRVVEWFSEQQGE